MTINFLTGAGNETTNVNASAVNTLACNKPANVADGDVLVAQVMAQTAMTTAGHTITGPTGWSLASATYPDDTRRPTLVFVKAIPSASAETATSYAFQTSPGTETGRWGIKINRVTGVDNTTPVDAASAYGANTVSGPVTIPGLTTVTNNAVLLAVIHLTGTQAQSPPVVTDPSGWTRYTSMLETTPGATGSDDSLVSLIKTLATAGAQANVSVTFTPGQSAVNSVMIALRPSSSSSFSGAAAMTSVSHLADIDTVATFDSGGWVAVSATGLTSAPTLVVPETGGWGSGTAMAPSGAALIQSADTMHSSTSAFGSAASLLEVASASMLSLTALASSGSRTTSVNASMSSATNLAGDSTRTAFGSTAMTSPTAFTDAASLIAVVTAVMVSPTSLASSETVVVPLTAAMSSVSQLSGNGSAVLASTFTMTSTTAFNLSASGSGPASVAYTSISAFAGAETLVTSEALAWLSTSSLADLTNLVAAVTAGMLSMTAMTTSTGAIVPSGQSMTSISALSAALTLQGPEILGMASLTVVGISATASYPRAAACSSATALGASGSRSTSTDAALTSISAFGQSATVIDVVTGAWMSATGLAADGILSNVHFCTLEMVSVTSLSFDAEVVKRTAASVLTPVQDEDLWEQAEGDPGMYVWLMRQQGLIMPPEDEVEPPLDWIDELPVVGWPDTDLGAWRG